MNQSRLEEVTAFHRHTCQGLAVGSTLREANLAQYDCDKNARVPDRWRVPAHLRSRRKLFSRVKDAQVFSNNIDRLARMQARPFQTALEAPVCNLLAVTKVLIRPEKVRHTVKSLTYVPCTERGGPTSRARSRVLDGGKVCPRRSDAGDSVDASTTSYPTEAPGRQ